MEADIAVGRGPRDSAVVVLFNFIGGPTCLVSSHLCGVGGEKRSCVPLWRTDLDGSKLRGCPNLARVTHRNCSLQRGHLLQPGRGGDTAGRSELEDGLGRYCATPLGSGSRLAVRTFAWPARRRTAAGPGRAPAVQDPAVQATLPTCSGAGPGHAPGSAPLLHRPRPAASVGGAALPRARPRPVP